MGIGTITPDAARVAANLRSWTGHVADAARLTGPPTANQPLRLLSAGNAGLATVDEALVRTIGWQMRDAVRWTPDGYCVQRANLTAMSAAQQAHGGDLAAAYASLGGQDGRIGAQLVAFAPARPGLGYEARFHSAALFHTSSADLVVDHLVAETADGVMRADDWLRAVAPRNPADVAVVAATNRPPASLRPSSGVPAGAPWMTPSDWTASGDQLATALERSATRHG